MAQEPLVLRQAYNDDLVDFVSLEKKELFYMPVSIGNPAGNVWLKLSYVRLIQFQVVEGLVMQTLFHPETGMPVYSQGQKLRIRIKDIYVVEKKK